MQFLEFSIKNFKGIKKVSLKLDKPNSKIFTLVGLNESGKTTILEALSFFHEGNESEEVSLHKSDVNVYSLMPKNRQDNFTDEIEISAKLYVSDAEIEKIKNEISKKKFNIEKIKNNFIFSHKYFFKDSSYDHKEISCDAGAYGRKTRKNSKLIAISENEEINKYFILEVQRRLPKIIYYPNFLFDFPDKIYLKEEEQEEKNEFYRNLLQDVLDSLRNGLDIQTHIVDRAIRSKQGGVGAHNDKATLESVLSKMGSQITKTIFNENIKVFRRDTSNKRISLEYPDIEGEDLENGILFTRLKLIDGEDNYYIRERSLGFKWFFTFLLFTQFRIHRSKDENLIFLLDEPASNLHQAAQQRLLKALESLTSESVSVIYTTHSHHLINPLWLENTFIVKNEALNYDVDNEDNYNSSMTNISIEKYRTFVSTHPGQRMYFQPILDVLDYRPSNLENIPDVIMTEGKNDFYTLSYIQQIIDTNLPLLKFLPGGGAGSLDVAIQLYYAWGRNFLVLLDADTEGGDQKARYIDKFGGIIKDRIFTLNDIDPSTDGSMESLFTSQERIEIIQTIYPQTKKFNKKKFNRAIQENLVTKTQYEISEPTQDKFIQIFKHLDQTISSLSQ